MTQSGPQRSSAPLKELTTRHSTGAYKRPRPTSGRSPSPDAGSSRSSISGSLNGSRASPASTPGTRGILEHRPKFTPSSGTSRSNDGQPQGTPISSSKKQSSASSMQPPSTHLHIGSRPLHILETPNKSSGLHHSSPMSNGSDKHNGSVLPKKSRLSEGSSRTSPRRSKLTPDVGQSADLGRNGQGSPDPSSSSLMPRRSMHSSVTLGPRIDSPKEGGFLHIRESVPMSNTPTSTSHTSSKRRSSGTPEKQRPSKRPRSSYPRPTMLVDLTIESEDDGDNNVPYRPSPDNVPYRPAHSRKSPSPFNHRAAKDGLSGRVGSVQPQNGQSTQPANSGVLKTSGNPAVSLASSTAGKRSTSPNDDGARSRVYRYLQTLQNPILTNPGYFAPWSTLSQNKPQTNAPKPQDHPKTAASQPEPVAQSAQTHTTVSKPLPPSAAMKSAPTTATAVPSSSFQAEPSTATVTRSTAVTTVHSLNTPTSSKLPSSIHSRPIDPAPAVDVDRYRAATVDPTVKPTSDSSSLTKETASTARNVVNDNSIFSAKVALPFGSPSSRTSTAPNAESGPSRPAPTRPPVPASASPFSRSTPGPPVSRSAQSASSPSDSQSTPSRPRVMTITETQHRRAIELARSQRSSYGNIFPVSESRGGTPPVKSPLINSSSPLPSANQSSTFPRATPATATGGPTSQPLSAESRSLSDQTGVVKMNPNSPFSSPYSSWAPDMVWNREKMKYEVRVPTANKDSISKGADTSRATGSAVDDGASTLGIGNDSRSHGSPVTQKNDSPSGSRTSALTVAPKPAPTGNPAISKLPADSSKHSSLPTAASMFSPYKSWSAQQLGSRVGALPTPSTSANTPNKSQSSPQTASQRTLSQSDVNLGSASRPTAQAGSAQSPSHANQRLVASRTNLNSTTIPSPLAASRPISGTKNAASAASHAVDTTTSQRRILQFDPAATKRMWSSWNKDGTLDHLPNGTRVTTSQPTQSQRDNKQQLVSSSASISPSSSLPVLTKSIPGAATKGMTGQSPSSTFPLQPSTATQQARYLLGSAQSAAPLSMIEQHLISSQPRPPSNLSPGSLTSGKSVVESPLSGARAPAAASTPAIEAEKRPNLGELSQSIVRSITPLSRSRPGDTSLSSLNSSPNRAEGSIQLTKGKGMTATPLSPQSPHPGDNILKARNDLWPFKVNEPFAPVLQIVEDIKGDKPSVFSQTIRNKVDREYPWRWKSARVRDIHPTIHWRSPLNPDYLLQLQVTQDRKVPRFSPSLAPPKLPFLRRNIRAGLKGLTAYHHPTNMRLRSVRDAVVQSRKGDRFMDLGKTQPKEWMHVKPMRARIWNIEADAIFQRRSEEERDPARARVRHVLRLRISQIKLFDRVTGKELKMSDFAAHGGPVLADLIMGPSTNGRVTPMTWRNIGIFNLNVDPAIDEILVDLKEQDYLKGINITMRHFLDRYGRPWPPVQTLVKSLHWTDTVKVTKKIEGHDVYVEDFDPIRLEVKDARHAANPIQISLGQAFKWELDYRQPMKRLPPKIRIRQPIDKVIIYYDLVSEHRRAQSEKDIDWARIPSGWCCAFCSLGDLGGEEELHTHFGIAHHNECIVEEYRRHKTEMYTRLFLRIWTGKAMSQAPQKAVHVAEPIALPTPISLAQPSGDSLSSEAGPEQLTELLVEPSSNEAMDVDTTGKPAADDPAVLYNPLGLAGPQMLDRKNQYTDWSYRVAPGTLADLMPELDKIYDGGEFRFYMRDNEESNIWMWHHLTDKRRFLCCCWNRWREQKGPMRTLGQSKYLKEWLDAYAPIMRRAEIEIEVKDMIYLLFHHYLIAREQLVEICKYWDDLARAERKAKGQMTEDDLWEEEQEREVRWRAEVAASGPRVALPNA